MKNKEFECKTCGDTGYMIKSININGDPEITLCLNPIHIIPIDQNVCEWEPDTKYPDMYRTSCQDELVKSGNMEKIWTFCPYCSKKLKKSDIVVDKYKITLQHIVKCTSLDNAKRMAKHVLGLS